MKVRISHHHRHGHHVDGHMRRLPHSRKMVRIDGHHRHGHNVVGHMRYY